jgi:hypothetical protein
MAHCDGVWRGVHLIRLVHHEDTYNIEGDSYRKKNHKIKAKKPAKLVDV